MGDTDPSIVALFLPGCETHSKSHPTLALFARDWAGSVRALILGLSLLQFSQDLLQPAFPAPPEMLTTQDYALVPTSPHDG